MFEVNSKTTERVTMRFSLILPHGISFVNIHSTTNHPATAVCGANCDANCDAAGGVNSVVGHNSCNRGGLASGRTKNF